MKKLITVKVPKESFNYYLNKIGCLRYEVQDKSYLVSGCVEPVEIGEYLEESKHKIIGYSFINDFKIVVIESI